jgi:hypothetical protein
MATQRQLQETVARCVSIMVYYRNEPRSERTRERMVAEVQLVAGWVMELGLVAEETGRHIFRPLEGELIARFGQAAGSRLHAEFVQAFEGLTMTSPHLMR